VTKADIVEKLVAGAGFKRLESIELVESVLEIIKDTIASGETVKVSGFGSFIVREKNHRMGRNPKTGEKLAIEARRVLTFKPSTVLKAAMNGVAAE